MTISTPRARLLLSLCLFAFLSPVAAQDAEDELGNWLIYNGTLRFSDRWSVFTEAQLRLYEVVSNPQEWFVRAAGQYNFNPDVLVAVGYLYSESRPFEERIVEDGDTSENRLYEQLTLRHGWDRAVLEHRYRLEQRWVDDAGETAYSNRARYRFQVTIPLTRPKLDPRTFFLNIYDEIFIGLGSTPTFDQNRLYLAGGYRFRPDANLQIGYLWQARTAADFHRLQLFLTYNFDFRKRTEHD